MRRRCPDLAKTQDMFPWVLQLEHADLGATVLGGPRSWHNGSDVGWGLTKKNIEDTIEKLSGDLVNMAGWLNTSGANPNIMAQEEEPEFAKWKDFL